MNTFPTLQDYAVDMRKGLRDFSKEGLSGLENMMLEVGYTWLESYMEGIFSRAASNAPIAQLIKTPSRTATTKKTRAQVAANQDRVAKLKGINGKASPSTKSTVANSKMPLSPLGARSINTNSPLPAPAKTSPIKPSKGKKEVKGKGKKGKGKKAAAVPATSPLRPIEGDIEMDESTIPEDVSAGSTSETTRHPPPTPSRLPRTIALSQAIPAAAALRDDALTSSVSDHATSSRNQPASSYPNPTADAIPTRDTEPIAESSTSTSANAPQTVKSAPQRQVRSSWLSKALGTGSVMPPTGIRPSDANHEVLRKSIAPIPQSKLTSMEYEYPASRKSLVPAGGLKRKSEIQEEPPVRPEKFTRMDESTTVPATNTMLSRPPFDRQISKESVTAARESTFPSRTTIQTIPTIPSEISTVPPTAAVAPRPDVNRVTRALDELRERNQAKENAAKAKAAAAVSTHKSNAQSTNTGTGFLRGVGNIGVGLTRSLGIGVNKGGDAAENARLQKAKEIEDEEEEKRRASLEAKEALARILHQSPAFHRVASPPAQTALASLAGEIDFAMDGEELENKDLDMNDEQKVLDDLDDLHPIDPDIPPSLPAGPTSRNVSRTSPPRPARQDLVSTTPLGTPPHAAPKAGGAQAPPLHDRYEKHQYPTPSKPSKAPAQIATLPPKELLLVKHDSDLSLKSSSQPSKSSKSTAPIVSVQSSRAASPKTDSRPNSAMDNDDTEDEEPEEEEEDQEDVTAKYPSRTLAKSSSQQSLAMSTTSSGTGMFGQASTIAGKVLGVRPQPGNVKSLQLAAAAQKKEQMAASDRKALREAAERRKQELADKKAEADRIRAEEERKIKIAELEEKRRARAEQERLRKENEEKKAAIARTKAAREEREKEKELAAARAKAEEEAKKRKLAQSAATLTESTTMTTSTTTATTLTTANTIKKIVPTAPIAAVPVQPIKSGPTIKLVSSAAAAASSNLVSVAGPSKLGPNIFRTADAAPNLMVTPSQPIAAPAPPRPLGPPARPSAMSTMTSQAQAIRNSVAVQAQSASVLQGPHGAVLQQSRIVLQSQLEDKVAEVQSEDIVLPDIASEYSDSDDEDRVKNWDRPQWAESPELRAALEQQASRDPDELFGPINPLNMEELFKARPNKFRARSSSANWHKGDGLTRAEEIEYARRMGFKPINQ